jgi:hypothetical protein
MAFGANSDSAQLSCDFSQYGGCVRGIVKGQFFRQLVIEEFGAVRRCESN